MDTGNQASLLESVAALNQTRKQEKTKFVLDRIGRNDPCTCGSGKKYKHCCIFKREGFVQDPVTKVWAKPVIKKIDSSQDYREKVIEVLGKNKLIGIQTEEGLKQEDEDRKIEEMQKNRLD